MKPIIKKSILSAVLFILYSVINFLLNPVATLVSGIEAGKQFDDSAGSYIESTLAMRFFGHLGIPFTVLVIILAVIWRNELIKWGKKFISPAVILFLLASPAHAYYDKTDYAEAVMIMPNESAFWVPDVGANKETQAKFGSVDYYETNKIAAKRFTIPHAKFSGSGFWADYYVPTGRLILVDRTPYHQEWTASYDRGTSTKDESFPCQSIEGINVKVEVAIAASVREEDAAKFLYWFGVNAPYCGEKACDRHDPNVVFTSVYYGRSLAQVMNAVGRGKVQTLVCKEIGARLFDKANGEVNIIMDAVEKSVTVWLSARGITLDYIGWAGTFTFDQGVQKAVNDKYIAATLAPSLPTLQALADVKVKEGLGDGLRSKGLPASLIAIPDRLLGSLGAMFGGKPSDAK